MTSLILRFKEVQRRIGGYSRMHVDRLEKAGKFPKRIRIGANAVGWDESEIERWVQIRKDARDQLDPSTDPETEVDDSTPAAPRKRGRPANPAHPAY